MTGSENDRRDVTTSPLKKIVERLTQSQEKVKEKLGTAENLSPQR